jgi:hypothetical protein
MNNTIKMLTVEVGQSIKCFFRRFYFEPIDKKNIALLPCVYSNSETRTFEIAFISWSFCISYGKKM